MPIGRGQEADRHDRTDGNEGQDDQADVPLGVTLGGRARGTDHLELVRPPTLGRGREYGRGVGFGSGRNRIGSPSGRRRWWRRRPCEAAGQGRRRRPWVAARSGLNRRPGPHPVAGWRRRGGPHRRPRPDSSEPGPNRSGLSRRAGPGPRTGPGGDAVGGTGGRDGTPGEGGRVGVGHGVRGGRIRGLGIRAATVVAGRDAAVGGRTQGAQAVQPSPQLNPPTAPAGRGSLARRSHTMRSEPTGYAAHRRRRLRHLVPQNGPRRQGGGHVRLLPTVGGCRPAFSYRTTPRE